ncbi:MAG: 2,3-bisphosphoglycerate-independent phosphoglycerate mutase [Holophagales bacterium]|nr:2,3-bisphosphoglycerate-independent phosphoglycerate mutase [Holophagales bacterium]MYD20649.1 2,3-bisphosphoglycerate-independent phosphoglycerate mutase [Holophagales bacterium]MYI34221.1 2,3-bisphosphoglycerate-independent phosphoglycerate mutase [Holophagales bacterium]
MPPRAAPTPRSVDSRASHGDPVSDHHGDSRFGDSHVRRRPYQWPLSAWILRRSGRARPGREAPELLQLSPATGAGGNLSATEAPERPIQVTDQGEAQPFSRGLLARSLYAAGLDFDHAYRRVEQLQRRLVREEITSLEKRHLAQRIAELLDVKEGSDVAGRYRLIRRLRRLPRPLIFYVGGAGGTGKSTLALDLAPQLRIYRVNATDTVRQVMRMVFAPAILPALHVSSYETAEATSPELPGGTQDPTLATFEEQATRVCVGVRAVVERAIAENLSLVVEGVHLLPGLVPFPDLDADAYQFFLLLTTDDEEVHRSHFLARETVAVRRSHRQLDHFRVLRAQQDHLIRLAEEVGVPVLDTTEREPALAAAIGLLGQNMSQRLPWLTQASVEGLGEPRPPVLMLVIDGLPDRPLRSLGGRTPLEAARTPNLDRLASEGANGLADPVAPGVVPDTASGNLALFSQSPRVMTRGPIEALGAGLKLKAGTIAIRGNFATLDERGYVVDRRAGRIRDDARKLAKAIDRLDLPASDRVKVRVRATTEHRLAITLRGDGLTSAIEGSDPGDGAPSGPPLVPRPLDPNDETAERTARVLALFEQEARRVLARHPANERRRRNGGLPANAVLTRGVGRVHRLLPLEPGGLPVSAACIGGDRTVMGIASALGVSTVHRPGMTANVDTDLALKFECGMEALAEHDLVMVHVKGADIAAHDRRPDQKVAFLERVDQELGVLLERLERPIRVAVTADHATLSEVGVHGADPVPVLIWGDGIRPDSVTSFGERVAGAGRLSRFPLQLLIERVFERYSDAET